MNNPNLNTKPEAEAPGVRWYGVHLTNLLGERSAVCMDTVSAAYLPRLGVYSSGLHRIG